MIREIGRTGNPGHRLPRGVRSGIRSGAAARGTEGLLPPGGMIGAVCLPPLCLLMIVPKQGLEGLIVVGGQQQNPGGVDETVGEDHQPEI